MCMNTPRVMFCHVEMGLGGVYVNYISLPCRVFPQVHSVRCIHHFTCRSWHCAEEWGNTAWTTLQEYYPRTPLQQSRYSKQLCSHQFLISWHILIIMCDVICNEYYLFIFLFCRITLNLTGQIPMLGRKMRTLKGETGAAKESTCCLWSAMQ